MVSLTRISTFSIGAGLSAMLCVGSALAEPQLKFDYKDAPNPGVVAKLGGVDVSVDELEAENKALKKDLSDAKDTVEVLKKSVAIFIKP